MNPEKIINKLPFDEALYGCFWFLSTMEKLMPQNGFSVAEREAVSKTVFILAKMIVEDSSCTFQGNPLIIQYTNLLHQHRDPQATEVQAFVALHKDDEVFMKRVRTLEKVWELK
jgi:hypothetical protein